MERATKKLEQVKAYLWQLILFIWLTQAKFQLSRMGAQQT